MDLSSIAADIASQRVEYIEELLANLPPGTRICVHDIEFTLEEPQFDHDSIKMRYKIDSHILPGTMTCDAKVRRTEYER